MKKMIVFLSLILASLSANAFLITGEAVVDENSKITIDYIFTADQEEVFAFDLFFDINLFDNIEIVANPDAQNWDVLILQSDAFFGEDGVLNFLSLLSPLAIGDALEGFTVQADFIGGLGVTEFTQDFELLDADGVTPLFVGGSSSSIVVEKAQVSSPASYSLITVLLVFVLGRKKLIFRF